MERSACRDLEIFVAGSEHVQSAQLLFNQSVLRLPFDNRVYRYHSSRLCAFGNISAMHIDFYRYLHILDDIYAIHIHAQACVCCCWCGYTRSRLSKFGILYRVGVWYTIRSLNHQFCHGLFPMTMNGICLSCIVQSNQLHEPLAITP